MEKKYFFKHRSIHEIEKPDSLENIKALGTNDIQVFEGARGWFWLEDFSEKQSNKNQSKK
jgi:hypothetical protein